jgi:hypothetical protein
VSQNVTYVHRFTERKSTKIKLRGILNVERDAYRTADAREREKKNRNSIEQLMNEKDKTAFHKDRNTSK